MSNDYQLSYLDLLMNSLGCVVLLFAITLLLVSPRTMDNGVKQKAEFLITVEWDKESNDDVDSYLQDPNGELVNYNRREDGLMHMDRDDRGKLNDQSRAKSGEVITFDENVENISIRSILPGEYVCNVHMYHRNDAGQETEVSVKIVKLNPVPQTIALKKVILKHTGDEVTVFRFTVAADGTVHDINDLEKKFTSTYGYPPEDENPDGQDGDN
jgi:hypothetical protein